MAKTEAVAAEFEDHTETLVEWSKANANKLAIGGLAVVAVAAVIFMWRAFSEKKETRASAALASAQIVVASGNAALAQSDLQALISRYGGTKAAIQGRMLLAQVHFGQGKVEDGIRELDAIGSAGPYAASVHALKGAGLEQSGKAAEAAEEYVKASGAAGTTVAKAGYNADAARAYVTAGNADAARRIWEAMANDDANPMAGEARVRLGELTVKPIGG
jgi:predicted negative regulator of RcsB-dependent stress response